MVPFLVGITKGFPVDLRVDIISETVQARIWMIPLLSCLSHILSLDPTGEDRKGEGLVALVEADVYLFRSVGCTFELFVYVLQNVSEGSCYFQEILWRYATWNWRPGPPWLISDQSISDS